MSANRSNIAWHLENQISGTDRRAIGMVYEKKVEITNAEIKALNGTPKELVAAPGANKLIEFLGAVLLLNYGSNVLTETGGDDNLGIEYNDGTGSPVCTAIEATGFMDEDADQMMKAVPIVLAGTIAAATNINKNLVLINNGDEYGGNATADTTMTVMISYRILDFNVKHPRFN